MLKIQVYYTNINIIMIFAVMTERVNHEFFLFFVYVLSLRSFVQPDQWLSVMGRKETPFPTSMF